MCNYTHIGVAFGMIDEPSRTRQLFCGIAPHLGALKLEKEHVPHAVVRRRLVLLFAVLVRQDGSTVVAHDLVLFEVAEHLNSATPARQVVDYLESFPGLTGHQF